MSSFTGLARASAVLTQMNLKDPRRFEAATLLEIAEVGRQQAITNEILSLNTRIAYENNHLVKGVLDAVEHLNEVSLRERTLKELLYQMTKLLKSDQRSEADPVELAFRARVFLHTVASHRLSTQDLADLEEKALFDDLSAQAQSLLQGDAFRELEAFEAVYAMYGATRKEDPCSGLKNLERPKQPPLVLPKSPDLKPFAEPEPPQTIEAAIAEDRWAAIIALVITGFLFLYCAGNGSWLGMLVWGAGSMLCVAWWRLSAPAKITKDQKKLAEIQKDLDKRRNKWTEAKRKHEESQGQIKAAHDEAVKAARAAHEPVMKKYAADMEEYQRQAKKRDEAKRVATERHEGLLAQMRTTINAFLEEHTGMQEFLPKV